MLAIILSVATLVAVAECYPGALKEESESFSEGVSALNEGTLDLESNVSLTSDFYSLAKLPFSWDWRQNRAGTGIINLVKDQGDCDAGWAFSIIGAIESHRQIFFGENDVLSEQFLIDCIVGSEDTHGCSNKYNPNLQKETYSELITKFIGVPRHWDYRKYSGNQSTCNDHLRASDPFPVPRKVPVTGFRNLYTDFFEQDMMIHLITKGPLVAAINSATMKTYKGGVDEPSVEDCDPSPSSMDHFVLVVGYGWELSEREIPYWIIKNSWGSNWGEEGFYYLVRGRNACGIANDISIPFVDYEYEHLP